jgi:hypothetical protein
MIVASWQLEKLAARDLVRKNGCELVAIQIATAAQHLLTHTRHGRHKTQNQSIVNRENKEQTKETV